MKDVVEKSIQTMKKMDTTQKIYNRYAQTHRLLCSYTIIRLTGKSYKEIVKS